MNKEDLKVGMKVLVKGKYDRGTSLVEILELGDGLMFTHKLVGLPFTIISCHKYTDIIKTVE